MARKYLDKLKGALVVVVGGSQGIGFAVAEASVEHGANVVIASRTQANVGAAVKRLKEAYPEAAANAIRGHTCDLKSENLEAQIMKLFDFATDNGKNPVDHVIDTAGEFPGMNNTPPASTTRETWLESYRDNFTGTALLASHSSKYLRQESSSSITLTSGVLINKPMKGMTTRIGPGAAKQSLAPTLAVNLAPIRVNIVIPGAINTGSLQDMMKAMGDVAAAEERFKSMTLLHAIGQVEDVAESYLCSMKNRFLTGTALNCEGGFFLK